MEHFQDSCQDPISWVEKNTFFLEFAEGWALYAEHPLISMYTDSYRNDPLTKYGMLKWQVYYMTFAEGLICVYSSLGVHLQEMLLFKQTNN